MKPTWKRILALILTLSLLVSLAACAGQAKPAEVPDAENTAEKPAADEGTAGKADTAEKPATDEGTVGKADTASEPALAGKPESPDVDLSGAIGDFYYEGGSPAFAAENAGRTAVAGEGPGEGAPAEPVEPVAGDEPVYIEDPVAPETVPADPGEPLKLTAAEWKDNDNWPFFTNLVNAGTVSFPSFGIDPRNCIRVTVTDADGTALPNEAVSLMAGETVLWTARTDRSGVAYVFSPEGTSPDRVISGEAEASVQIREGGDAQNPGMVRPVGDVALTKAPAAPVQIGMQVLFIVDTTGSMTDELAYLQKDFSAIAERVGAEGMRYSVSFYRDEGDVYVTRHSEFSSDVAAIQALINAEYADGGGDEPEAVAEVLTECLTERTDWDEGAAKLAFLIFDAPPHTGREAELLAAVQAAAEKGIFLIPVVASNAQRDTELFGRALAICTNGTYVFLTDDSGIGESHLEPIVGDYTVELLQDLIVRIIERHRPA